ncbi:CMGC/MAPK protein Kinase [Phytophthora palmivora]|uniref:CMGC/MAPK protein Kinase n=1 Tax=Phytophthora palmivora TaxID=4796 RepID=A0A2P4WZ91_9STRA|nr:CMGC/MAPK protein Kinase [Phytophthora palmivora]
MGRDDRSVPVMTENGFTINGCSFNVDPKYQPVDAIGQGSYGVVCSVRNTKTDEKLAIKKITPMAGDEWDATHTLREIRLMRCLGAHENIISLKDLSMCKEKDELYMMMELADTDLHRLIQSSCPLTEGHIRVIMYQVLSGVKAMHDNGVLHRDLKPGNLLLNKDCELKITDFGLARMMPKKSQPENEQASGNEVSMMTEYVVTRWYRPPELMLAPNGSYDGAVDMWSVGCILGELVSRKPLFPGTDFMDQLTRVFQVLPIPEPEDRGYVIEKDALKFLSSLPPPAPGALETKLGDIAGPQAMDLLRRLLCFNPKQRISVDDALAHPFFEGVQEEWGEITPLHLPHSLEFAFETQSLPLATLRQYICDEVLNCTIRRQPEPHETEPQTTNYEKAAASKVSSSANTNNNDSPPVLENDCPIGSGFTLKGCDFNVPAKYKPLQVLGEGSYGIVCAATDTDTQKNVAIKKITPMAGDEWDAKHTLREIRLMRYFGKHPNIASLQNLSTCIEKDELYLMMDLVDTDLHRLIQNHEDQQPRHAVDKTQELMTEYVVTRWYRPPEIMLAPTGTYNEAVDMWSIGCIFGELLNRRPMFPGADFLDQLSRVFNVLPVPPRDKRGYDVEGDALAFLESLPPCSPSALSKLFRRASPEAISLLRRLLCVNPSRRISAKQALAHPYFKSIRAQLGEPPAFRVDKAFDFEFDYHEFSLAHLKTLIQSEVKLLQKDGLPPPIPETELVKTATTYEEDDEFDEAYEQEAVVSEIKQEIVTVKEDRKEMEQAKAVESHKNTATILVPTRLEDDSIAAVSKTNGHAEPEMDECEQISSGSESDNTHHKAQRQQQEDEEVEIIPHTKQPVAVESDKQNNDDHDKPQRLVKTAGRSERSVVSGTPMSKEPSSGATSRRTLSATSRTTKTSSSLARPKSAGTITRRTTPTSTSRSSSGGISYRSQDSRDEDEVSSIASTSSNNRYHHNNNNSLDSVEHRGKWGHPRASAMASTASSRLHRSSHSVSTSSLATNDRRSHIVKTAPISARTGSAKLSSSNNQLSSRGGESIDRDSVKSDALRGPERVSSTVSAATASSIRRQTSGTGIARPSSSTRKESLPEGWIRRTHSKSGREYFYDTLNKVASWKLPVKHQPLKHQPLDNIFAGSSSASTSSSSTSRAAYNNRQNVQIVPGTSSTASSPSSALTPESYTSRGSVGSMLSSRRTGSSTSNLPKEWARRTDPKTGRLFYVNLVTNRSYARLPSSVTAAMLNLGRDAVVSKRAAAEALNRKKATVPHSPQFSQMSWQRKRVPNTDD